MNKEKGAEQKLLELGMAELERGGIRGLRVRRLCAAANVSPGTFTAFFKTKRAFADRLLEQWYGTLKAAIGPHRKTPGSAWERLRAELEATVRFAWNNLGVLLQLAQDVGAGEASVHALVRVARLNHVEWLHQAIRDAQKDGCIVPGHPWHLLAYMFGAANMPLFIFHTLNAPHAFGASSSAERGGGHSEALQGLFAEIFAEIDGLGSALRRMEWALAGITLRKGGKA